MQITIFQATNPKLFLNWYAHFSAMLEDGIAAKEEASMIFSSAP